MQKTQTEFEILRISAAEILRILVKITTNCVLEIFSGGRLTRKHDEGVFWSQLCIRCYALTQER